MTIKELYKWAEEHGVENHDLLFWDYSAEELVTEESLLIKSYGVRIV